MRRMPGVSYSLRRNVERLITFVSMPEPLMFFPISSNTTFRLSTGSRPMRFGLTSAALFLPYHLVRRQRPQYGRLIMRILHKGYTAKWAIQPE